MFYAATIILGALLLVVAYVQYRVQAFIATNKLHFITAPEELIATRNKSTTVKTHPSVYLVIGGSGNLGKLTVRQLLDLGRTVQVVDLHNAWSHEPRVLFIQGDITKPIDMEIAMRGVTHVIHHASVIALGVYDHKILKRVNIDGTRNVMEAAYKSPSVRSVVYTSSVCQYGYNSKPTMESIPPITRVQHFYPYFRAKAIAEKYVLDCNSPAVRTAAVRAAAVLGRNFDIMRHMKDPNSPLVILKGTKEGFGHAEDLARAHILLSDALDDSVRSDVCSGKPYMISGCADADSIDRQMLFTNIFRTLHNGKTPTIINSYLIMKLLSLIADFGQIAQVFGKSPLDFGPIMIFHRGIFDYMFYDITLRQEERAALKRLGYEPHFTVSMAVKSLAKYPESVSQD
ncbi:3 beta-hydroxysteroid dehydrogenase type 7 [Rhizoclosmatium sp. JEL0117]|nr:3 beta-hydroxysteroid dehydrogenase type 7 [Rhizoclosmatium sp. JEL0117]